MRKTIRTPDFPIADTADGKLHGFKLDQVYHFRGIRYASAERFEMPSPVEPWTGVRDAKAFGYIAPLLPEKPHQEGDPGGAPENTFEMPHVYWPESENCQYLNVWTRHLNEDAKRPVLVWLHGGGFCAGSSIELPSYDGHNLAEHGDVVVVNLNHRLNVIGFLDLSSFGGEYQYTGCLGMADIVEALRWVRRNIAAFGGDPDNVTVAGQSGGGGKVAALLQMPAADGLYAKAIIQSGSMRETKFYAPDEKEPIRILQEEKEGWQELGRRTAKELGLTEETIGKIRTALYKELAKAALRAAKALHRNTGMMLLEPSPVKGFYEGSCACAGFRRETEHIPVMIGTNLGEFTFMHYLGYKDRYTEEEKKNLLQKELGENTEEILKEFTKIYPDKDILYAMSVDTKFRRPAAAMARARSRWAKAPVFVYQMNLIVPYLGGLALWHCGEIPFVFRNTENELTLCTSEAAEKLQEEVSAAWLRFMETGSPSGEDLAWDPYTPEKPEVMFLDESSGQVRESDGRLLELLSAGRPPFLA